MTPILDGYELLTPATIDQALALLADDPAARPFAGGTDLMVLLHAAALPPGRYVNLWGLSELVGIAETAHGVRVGAMTTYTQIRHSSILIREYPLLPIAAAETDAIATQNRGTIGGNIANASPAADTPPVLLVYDAELELRSHSGTRRVPYRDFHRGYKQMDLRPGEIIAAVHLPPGAQDASAAGEQWRDYYRKVGTRRAQAISKVCFAGSILVESGRVSDVRIALGSVAPTPIRAARTEDALKGRPLASRALDAACEALLSEISPMDDLRSTARYRARVACNLLRDFLQI